MKKLAYTLVMIAFISSCTGSSEPETTTPNLPDPIIEFENTEEMMSEEEVNLENTEENVEESTEEMMNEDETIEGEDMTNSGSTDEITNEEETSVSTDIRAELESGTENEQAVLEILNEIEEVFELAEQNGGQ